MALSGKIQGSSIVDPSEGFQASEQLLQHFVKQEEHIVIIIIIINLLTVSLQLKASAVLTKYRQTPFLHYEKVKAIMHVIQYKATSNLHPSSTELTH